MDHTVLRETIDQRWRAALPALMDFVRIPALSPAFDPQWAENGHIDAAVTHLQTWISGRNLPGADIFVERLPNLSPLLVVDVPASAGATSTKTVLLYGHLDKQPGLDGWTHSDGPWDPTIKGDRLYGRGAVDDGYAGFSAVTALESLLAANGEHPRCVLLLETSEESGSPDLPAYLTHLTDRLGDVSLVVCLDSGAGDYERMWLTTSLRGLASVSLTVSTLKSGVHSGMAGGPVASSFRITRQLLDRVEDSATGRILIPELNVPVPADRLKETQGAAETLPGAWRFVLPLQDGVELDSADEVEQHLLNTWRPALEIIGAEGLPPVADAGNVLRPSTTLRLSFRLPPTVDADRAIETIVATLTTDVPRGAVVTVTDIEAANGWNAPTTAPWLHDALTEVSDTVFHNPWRAMGVGGSIPFMGLLHEANPDAQFVITGALGPDSNAHVPDESLNFDFAGRITEGIAVILHRAAQQP
ncbi:M20/M25/M40 family metallo-hydrolase [Hoyosella rhizosphaerae]|uniref:Peptidase M20 n=1 Tax=Hoyosella rhizosphaerae TaxID=1755582 RepID=A0A916U8L4_9ACTN|nr:M20/M25/M40 family metallo-hydrolase [Hoyosella rhizosphaerae]MBN4927598.1 M20/M25/M40 family metallo-hydrolase [Hoyosella rhizosphaerae]GGC63212.1 peptidase M20 [Hoyosella rhizosphaerae]